MFTTYLRRELAGRRKQTAIVAIGMALAIALVIIVNAVSSGVQLAQAKVLESVYGVGTDVTVSQTPTPPTAGPTDARGGGPQRFDFGATDGASTDGTTSVSQSRLEAGRGTATFDASALDTITGIDNVDAAAATLSLTNTTFDGQLPDRAQANSGGTAPTDGTAPAAGQGPPAGGPDGAGGSSFNVDSFSVLGIDPAKEAVGPLSAVTLTDGRALTSDDAGTNVAVLDAGYATTASVAVGDTISIAGTDFSVVGQVTAASSDAATASNVYIPLDLAQTLSGQAGQVSDVYVQAASSTDIDQVQKDIEAALPDATVKTQADLASSVSGSLSSASDLVANLGLWLSLIVLAAAFLIAILFTISGVTRRTREFGTLKAIGWSNGRIVRQVAGESLVQGLLGGAAGIAIGLVGILVLNLVSPTLTAGATTLAAPGAGGPGGGRGGFGQAAQAAATSDIALSAPVTVSVILIAVGLAVLGGLLAGAIGGWRASRLRPAEALRSVA
jgi:ABC-type lipoprotein release transport system permease subunit